MSYIILHGGKTSKDLPQNDKFFTEFTDFPHKTTVKIVLCYWAMDEDTWQQVSDRDSNAIKKFATHKKVTIVVAKDKYHFEANIKDADVVYFGGGVYAKLYEAIKQIDDINAQLASKRVIGSSAGAFLLCKQSLNSFDEQPTEVNIGIGLVPLSVLCHWNVEAEKEEKIIKLKTYSPTDALLLLDEGEYSRFTY